ncbi:FAD-dependent monooxygenase [Herbiconiux sp. 11R-BC]|uniref:FAD-dependent monooxygenase n=1 Tax=Herbiconiux sp. 11R-BC TaxID=3111637 RepID=UPI003C0E5927
MKPGEVRSPESGPARVIVIGCGIGGITTALALAQKGVKATVYERAQEIREVGAGLQVGPNAVRILERLGVTRYLTQAIVLPDRAVMRDIRTGEEVFAIQFGDQFTKRYGAPYQVMHRGDLLAALVRTAQETGLVSIVPAKELIGVEQDADTVTATFADGSSALAEVLVGADGIRSHVRRILGDNEPPLASTYAIYRGTFDRTDDIENAVTLQVGHEHHVMYYPIKAGTMVNLVCSFRSVTDAPGGDAWGAITELDDRFAGANPVVRRAVRQLDRSKRWTQFDRAPQPGWVQGRIVLTGDAAHPTHQYFAQGACQAMEDGIELAELIANSDDLSDRLQEFEERRYPRTSAVQRGSRFWGEWSHVGGAEAVRRDEVLRSVAPDIYRHLDWLYGNDPTAPIPRIPESRDDYEVIASERAAYDKRVTAS